MPVIMKPTSTIIAELGLKPNGAVHQFFTNTCANHMDKYVPFDEGILAGTVMVGTDTITYDQEYASYQYRGMREDGTHVIVNRTRTKHPLATSYWDRHMVTAEMPEIQNEVQDFINHGGI